MRIGASIIGQEAVIERVLIVLLADGHLLLEGLPGLAKTRTIKALARNLEAEYRRIQFTPDLLPADVTGTEIYLGESGKGFEFRPGPIFGNLVLADEINRAPAKAQAALLEAMEERQVTVAGTTHKLPSLFMVLATQNPIEQEGTYPLPEAQMDRFLLHTVIDYPTDEEEKRILALVRGEEGKAVEADAAPLPQSVIERARAEVRDLYVSDQLADYMVALIGATRRPAEFDPNLSKWIEYGASPRGTLAIDRCARAHAWLRGGSFATPEDVRAVALDCLRHRLILSYEATAEGVTKEQVVEQLLQVVSPV